MSLISFQPGPYELSRRLAMARWSDVAGAAERGDMNLTSDRVTVVGNSQSGERFPVTMPDGDEFYGIYPVCMKCRVGLFIMNELKFCHSTKMSLHKFS